MPVDGFTRAAVGLTTICLGAGASVDPEVTSSSQEVSLCNSNSMALSLPRAGGWTDLPADVTVSPPDVALTLLLLSTAASEPMGSYAQMGWYAHREV